MDNSEQGSVGPGGDSCNFKRSSLVVCSIGSAADSIPGGRLFQLFFVSGYRGAKVMKHGEQPPQAVEMLCSSALETPPLGSAMGLCWHACSGMSKL